MINRSIETLTNSKVEKNQKKKKQILKKIFRELGNYFEQFLISSKNKIAELRPEIKVSLEKTCYLSCL
jgi:intergrase/recombinase